MHVIGPLCLVQQRHGIHFLKTLGDTVSIHYDFTKERSGKSYDKTYKRPYVPMAQGDLPPKYPRPRSSGNDTHCSHAASGRVFLVWLLCVSFGLLTCYPPAKSIMQHCTSPIPWGTFVHNKQRLLLPLDGIHQTTNDSFDSFHDSMVDINQDPCQRRRERS